MRVPAPYDASSSNVLVHDVYVAHHIHRLLQIPVRMESFVTARYSACGANERGHVPFDVVVINLQERNDRRERIRSELAKAGASATRFVAKMGADAPEWLVTATWDSTLNSQFDVNTLAQASIRMSLGERGCAMSHSLLWAIVARRSDDASPLLILEDDVTIVSSTFCADTARCVAAIEAEFEPASRNVVLYIGAHVAKWGSQRTKSVAPNLGIREAEYTWQTSSYIVWPVTARILLSALPVDCPIDCYMSKHTMQRRVRSFVVVPHIVAQRFPYADGDIAHTNVFVQKDNVGAQA